jgi:hypothetical protein
VIFFSMLSVGIERVKSNKSRWKAVWLSIHEYERIAVIAQTESQPRFHAKNQSIIHLLQLCKSLICINSWSWTVGGDSTHSMITKFSSEELVHHLCHFHASFQFPSGWKSEAGDHVVRVAEALAITIDWSELHSVWNLEVTRNRKFWYWNRGKSRPGLSMSRLSTSFGEESKQSTNRTPLKSKIPFSALLKLTLAFLILE